MFQSSRNTRRTSKYEGLKKKFIFEFLPKFAIVFGLIGTIFPITGLLMDCLEEPILFIFFISLMIFCGWMLYQAFKMYFKYKDE